MNDDILYKWASIARAMHVSEKTIKRWCFEAHIKLPHWGKGRGAPVWLDKDNVHTLWEVLLVSRVSGRVKSLRKRVEEKTSPNQNIGKGNLSQDILDPRKENDL